jgi:hypothetical protein
VPESSRLAIGGISHDEASDSVEMPLNEFKRLAETSGILDLDMMRGRKRLGMS